MAKCRMSGSEVLGPKAEWAPIQKIDGRDQLGDKVNLTLAVNRYEGLEYDPSLGVSIPWMLNGAVLLEADGSDPANQLRVFSVSIGGQLSYRIVMTDFVDKDCVLLGMLGMFMLGVERADEIRAAIAGVREDQTKAAD